LQHAKILRMEIPYGHFERRIELPPIPFENFRPASSMAPLAAPAEGSAVMDRENPRHTASPIRHAAARRGSAANRPRSYAVASVPADALIPDTTRNLVLFPGIVLADTLGRQRSVAAAQTAIRLIARLASCCSAKPRPTTRCGRFASRRHRGEPAALCDQPRRKPSCDCRASAASRHGFLAGYPFFVARVEPVPETEEQNTEIEARWSICAIWRSKPSAAAADSPGELVNAVQSVTSAPALADLIASLGHTRSRTGDPRNLRDRAPALERVSELLSHRLEVLRRRRRSATAPRDDRRSPARVLLREQLKTIQQELGEAMTPRARRSPNCGARSGAKMPPEVEAHAKKEVAAASNAMPEAAGEYSMARTYLEWLIELPWAIRGRGASRRRGGAPYPRRGPLRLAQGQRRILEFLRSTAQPRRPQPDPMLCRAARGRQDLARPKHRARHGAQIIVRVSLGGTHDEAEIRGHRRTYIGALPRQYPARDPSRRHRNCVMMLDEIDKLGAASRATRPPRFLEVLDPNRTRPSGTITSGAVRPVAVMFITTANVLDSVPGRSGTAWRSSTSRATPRTKNSRSPGVICRPAARRQRPHRRAG